ncbi:MAG: hypothetical protein DDT28_01241 [Dehalococcoidia bacterium]|nr:hypothetical protein [Chloroflexota bacterium]
MTLITRRFITVDYEATLDLTVSMRECLPPNHLARFVVDMIAQLDLNCIYVRYETRGGKAYAPEILLGLLFYGYATGVLRGRLKRPPMSRSPFAILRALCTPTTIPLPIFGRPFCPKFGSCLSKSCCWRKQQAGSTWAISAWTGRKSTLTLPRAKQ